MCGIAGILGRLEDGNRSALARMSAAMVHRGPDGEGTWESSPDGAGRGVLLAHRRLAILDLSPAGAQPMVDPLSGDVVAFNGEIYNYLDLRARLGRAGAGLQSTGDTAVMLRALSLHGADAVPWLRGMFAFAFWDSDKRTLLVARDPLGIKPLYVARNPDPSGDWSIAFASEVRALLSSGLLGTPRLDPAAAASMLWNGFVMGPGTAIAGVESVWAGELVEYPARGAERRRTYWTLPRPGAGDPVDESRLAEVLEEGLRLHLASDVPLAVFLSGGVDSSAVANLAQRAQRSPVHTFTLAFEEDDLNEGPAARRIAEAIGTSHQEVVLTEQHFVGHLERAVDSLDQPTFDGLNSYFMSRAIRDAGFTVALVGTGGDELFGGYKSFHDLPLLAQWGKRLRAVPGGLLALGAAAAASVMAPRRGEISPQTRWAKLPAMAECRDDLLRLYQLAYALFLPDFQRELALDLSGRELRDGLPLAMRERLAAEIAGRSPLGAISVLEQRLFLGERLLRDNDAVSMSASIEQRVPLVDQVLAECVARLPDSVRYQPVGRKALLRRTGLRGLDPALFERPKSGFVLPLDRWIRQELGKRMDEALHDPSRLRAAGLNPPAVLRLWRAFQDGAPGIYWSRIWAVYVLVRWCERHGARV